MSALTSLISVSVNQSMMKLVREEGILQVSLPWCHRGSTRSAEVEEATIVAMVCMGTVLSTGAV